MHIHFFIMTSFKIFDTSYKKWNVFKVILLKSIDIFLNFNRHIYFI